MDRNNRSYELFADLKLEEALDPAAGAPAAPEKRPDEPDEPLIMGNETILLVDDEEIIIDVARDMLEILGYQVIAAQRGRQAVDIYTRLKDKIDLVIQDMVMPGMNGAEVFLALKEINPKVKVILASGYIMNRQIEAVMQQGCRAFMPKPFRLDELSKKVREILDSP
jgi:two-component system, cell cycle sensor histidine kinase and response regulator CckA